MTKAENEPQSTRINRETEMSQGEANGKRGTVPSDLERAVQYRIWNVPDSIGILPDLRALEIPEHRVQGANQEGCQGE